MELVVDCLDPGGFEHALGGWGESGELQPGRGDGGGGQEGLGQYAQTVGTPSKSGHEGLGRYTVMKAWVSTHRQSVHPAMKALVISHSKSGHEGLD